jgi:hypothetical protein
MEPKMDAGEIEYWGTKARLLDDGKRKKVNILCVETYEL